MPRSITAATLATRFAADDAPCIIDVRRTPAYAAAEDALPQAIRRPPETVRAWSRDLPAGRPVVVYCVHGHEVGKLAASALADLGFDAAYLEGGIEGWRADGHPVAAKPARSTLWVTRERPKIDRIACPWLIRRFVDPEARFLYVPAARVAAVASETGAIPYDVPDVALTHAGERCSFDAFVDHYGLAGPAMDRLALIVRGADTARFDLAPPAAGLFAISLGLSALYPDDHALLEQGLIVYDALHTWCGHLQGEAHRWPPQMAA